MQHRRRTAPARLRAAAAVLLACGTLAGTGLAAAGGAGPDPAAAVVQFARQQVGDGYAWGGNGPDSWDCSGLTLRSWQVAGGVTGMPRVADDQLAWTVPLPAEQALPGDLVFFGDPATHVGLYAGNGMMIDASSSQRGVLERKIWTGDLVRYGRVPRPGMPAVQPWAGPAAATQPPASLNPADAAPNPAAPNSPAENPAPAAPPAVAPAAPPVAPAPALLRGLPAPDLPAPGPLTSRAIGNARSVLGSPSWTDLELIRVAWRHAGGAALPASRAAVAATGISVPLAAVRIGDLVVYGAPVDHLGIYLGHGYQIDGAQRPGRVVIRRVVDSPGVRFVRLPEPAAAPVRAPAPAAESAPPLSGLPARDLPALTAVAARAVGNALSVRGSAAWTDLELVRAAWRHAGGGTLPADRVAVAQRGSSVPLAQVRIGDLVAYGMPASHLGLYLGHGYMIDATVAPTVVVVRRVFQAPTVRFIRPAVR